MNLKIGVLALVILLLIGGSIILDHGHPLNRRYLNDSVRLLPATSGPYRLSSTSRSEFSQLIGDPVVEQEAVYSNGPQGDQIGLDLMLNQIGTHNAIACYLARGEKLLWQRVIKIQTKHEGATLAIAALSDRNQVHLVGSTQCWKDGCEEHLATVSGLSVQFLTFSNPFVAQSRPVSVVLSKEAGNRDLYGAALCSGGVLKLQEFLSGFDLSSIKKAAAARVVGL